MTKTVIAGLAGWRGTVVSAVRRDRAVVSALCRDPAYGGARFSAVMPRVWDFCHFVLEFVSDFDIRISDLKDDFVFACRAATTDSGEVPDTA